MNENVTKKPFFQGRRLRPINRFVGMNQIINSQTSESLYDRQFPAGPFFFEIGKAALAPKPQTSTLDHSQQFRVVVCRLDVLPSGFFDPDPLLMALISKGNGETTEHYNDHG